MVRRKGLRQGSDMRVVEVEDDIPELPPAYMRGFFSRLRRRGTAKE